MPTTRLRELGAVDHAVVDGARETRLDQRRRGAGIEAMHGLVGIVHGHAGVGKQLRRGRLAHADRAGEAEHDHVLPLDVGDDEFAQARPITSGSTPNHLSKAGAA